MWTPPISNLVRRGSQDSPQAFYKRFSGPIRALPPEPAGADAWRATTYGHGVLQTNPHGSALDQARSCRASSIARSTSGRLADCRTEAACRCREDVGHEAPPLNTRLKLAGGDPLRDTECCAPCGARALSPTPAPPGGAPGAFAASPRGAPLPPE